MNLSIEVEDEGWRCLPALEMLATRAVKASLPVGETRHITIVFIGDSDMRELNKTWRNKDMPTNVLSFPAAKTMPLPQGEIGALGDLALGYDTVKREAQEQGKTIADHTSHLIVHGILHLLGYDHETEEEAAAMEKQERTILASLGIQDPYTT